MRKYTPGGIDGNELRVDDGIHEQMVRYSQEYGEGGWQERLKQILAKMVRE